MSTKIIAFYLPQFHQTDENDLFWGEGFTEWTLVGKAKPLFKGHKQPRESIHFGEYDLMNEDIRHGQGQLAMDYGVDVFCYWHYYFGEGKTVLDKPLNQMLEDGQPDIPFMLAWANKSWTANWKGRPDEVLIEQTYSETDHKKHYQRIMQFVSSEYCSHIEHEGRIPFVILYPGNVPELSQMKVKWNKWLKEDMGKEFLFIGYHRYGFSKNENAIDCWLEHEYLFSKNGDRVRSLFYKKLRRPFFVNYKKMLNRFKQLKHSVNSFPVIYSDWDNTPRMIKQSFIFKGFNTKLFHGFLRVGQDIQQKRKDKLIFIKSWNEWAEGNVLEPDNVNGFSVLRTIKKFKEEL